MKGKLIAPNLYHALRSGLTSYINEMVIQQDVSLHDFHEVLRFIILLDSYYPAQFYCCKDYPRRRNFSHLELLSFILAIWFSLHYNILYKIYVKLATLNLNKLPQVAEMAKINANEHFFVYRM